MTRPSSVTRSWPLRFYLWKISDILYLPIDSLTENENNTLTFRFAIIVAGNIFIMNIFWMWREFKGFNSYLYSFKALLSLDRSERSVLTYGRGLRVQLMPLCKTIAVSWVWLLWLQSFTLVGNQQTLSCFMVVFGSSIWTMLLSISVVFVLS